MSNSNRNIRLGIVYRGSVIHEEVIERKIDISIGRRAGATVQVSPKDHPEFPEFIDFMVFDHGQHYLVVPSDPLARVSLRGAAAGGAATIKGRQGLPIESAAGGSITQGDVTVMFQFVRGDSHPTETRDRTVLRLGLVFDERLIDDRIYPNTKEVSIGNARACSIVLPPEDYQGPPLVFQNHTDGSVTMRAPSAMKIRVAIDEQPLELKDLQARGKARVEGESTLCHFALGTRGRAVMGSHTVLFQVVKQTVTVPVLQRKTFGQALIRGVLGDPAWWVSFTVSLLCFGGIAAQAHYYQTHTGRFLDKARAAEVDEARMPIEVVVEQKEPDKPKEPEKAEDTKEPEPTAPAMVPSKQEKVPAKADKSADAKKNSGPAAADPEDSTRIRRAEADDSVKKNTVAGAFEGSKGSKFYQEAGAGETGDVVARTFGDTGGDGGDGKDGSPGIKIATGKAAGAGVQRVGGTGDGKGLIGNRDQKVVESGAKKAPEEKVNINFSPGSMEGSGEGKDEIKKMIARKNSAVQRCYEEALRDNPGEGGKVKVTFTVGTEGTVTDVSVSGASGKFADCIKAKFSSIRGLPDLASPQTFSQSYVFSKG